MRRLARRRCGARVARRRHRPRARPVRPAEPRVPRVRGVVAPSACGAVAHRPPVQRGCCLAALRLAEDRRRCGEVSDDGHRPRDRHRGPPMGHGFAVGMSRCRRGAGSARGCFADPLGGAVHRAAAARPIPGVHRHPQVRCALRGARRARLAARRAGGSSGIETFGVRRQPLLLGEASRPLRQHVAETLPCGRWLPALRAGGVLAVRRAVLLGARGPRGLEPCRREPPDRRHRRRPGLARGVRAFRGARSPLPGDVGGVFLLTWGRHERSEGHVGVFAATQIDAPCAPEAPNTL
mmetsp:Transcript_126667/g.366638  ORF Transcript_126667/g.366638 Transcript_126667/m.366638 type:complete len:294 (-) Transcript_126667:21-902(-)